MGGRRSDYSESKVQRGLETKSTSVIQKHSSFIQRDMQSRNRLYQERGYVRRRYEGQSRSSSSSS
jgi:hypothetical protein